MNINTTSLRAVFMLIFLSFVGMNSLPGQTPLRTKATVPAATLPKFSNPSGAFYQPFSLSISDSTSCATIYYTTDGTAPTPSSSVYTAPIQLSSTTMVKAIAKCTGGSASSTLSGTYTFAPAPKPVFSAKAGTYSTPVSVQMTSTAACAALYYTTDGSLPTTSSARFSSPITVRSNTVINAISLCNGGIPSFVSTASYKLVAPAAPTFSSPAGSYNRSVSVTIKDCTSGAVIHYTTDGSVPTAASPVASVPVTLTNSSSQSSKQTLSAVAISSSGISSATSSVIYTILNPNAPVASANSQASFFGTTPIVLQQNSDWPQISAGTIRIWGWTNLWAVLNPSRGTYDWSALDNEIAAAQAHGAQLIFTFGAVPQWAIPSNLVITSISRTSNVVKVTTAVPHHLFYNSTYPKSDQSRITIKGVADTTFNGTFTLSGTPDATTLTFAQTGTTASSTGGSVTSTCGGNADPTGCAEAPLQLSDWDAFVQALIQHLGPGVIKYWEMWNEANLGDTWRGDPAYLVTMASDARNIIKATDPNAVILSPSTTIDFETQDLCQNYDARCGSTWLNKWLAAGGAKVIDGVAFHGYPEYGEAPEQIAGQITLQQMAMNQNGVGSLPIIDTESSWGTNDLVNDPQAQVQFLSRHLMIEHSMGLAASSWYSYDDTDWGTLWTTTGGLTAPGFALNEIAQWLTGTTISQACTPAVADPNTWTCSYTRPNGYQGLAVWNTAGISSYTVPAGFNQYRDPNGNLIAMAGTTVTTSPLPILLENQSAF